MSRSIIFLIASICSPLVSCSKKCDHSITIKEIIPNYDKTLTISDNELLDYLGFSEMFLDTTFKKINTIRFITEKELEGLKTTVVGICVTKDRTILIRKSTFKARNESWRIALVLHEIGHCEYRLPHTTEQTTSECDGKIMHPIVGCSEKAFIENTDLQIKEELQLR